VERIALIDVRFESSGTVNMNEQLRIRGSDLLYRLLFVEGRPWSYHDLEIQVESSWKRWEQHYSANVVFEATPNERLLLEIEGKYKVMTY